MTTAQNKPVKTFFQAPVTVAVWKNYHDNKAFYSVSVQSSYKKDDEWKQSEYHNSRDLFTLAGLITRAANWIAYQTQDDTQ